MRVRGYRCLSDLELDVDDYTVVVGPNGSGKSSILYALAWFFHGGDIVEQDICDSIADGDEERRIEVEVSFSDLNDADRDVLGMYARGPTTTFRRSWSPVSGMKIIGNALQGPGFSAVRSAKSANDKKIAYADVRAEVDGLPAWSSAAAAEAALTSWETYPGNADKLVTVADADATHLFGFAGESILAKRFRMILVPAAADLATEVGTAGKGSILGQLLGAVTSAAVDQAREAWEQENHKIIERLQQSIRESVADVTRTHQERINAHFNELIADAQVVFEGQAPAWAMRGDATIRADVVVSGRRAGVERQGHGVQRAVLMAAVQALVPDPQLGGTDSVGSSAPALLLALEEPEIYQHPVRARHFARVLKAIGSRPSSQVILATHSPYFVLPEQFASLRRCTALTGVTSAWSTSGREVAAKCGLDPDKVGKVMEREVPRAFSEGFFADTVLIVEGDTGRVVLEALAERRGTPLDVHGIAVLAMGSKDNLQIPAVVLRSLGIPVFVMADGDADAAARGHPADEAKAANARKSHEAATNRLLGWLGPSAARFGQAAEGFGEQSCVCTTWALLHDDLETELALWPGFNEALEEAGGRLRGKNVLAYRSAASVAPVEAAPEVLLAVIDAVIALRASHGVAANP